MEDFSTNNPQNTGLPSGSENNHPAGQTLGIAALITAIVTFVLAVIPCIGIVAMVPALIAVVLAALGLSQASRTGANRSLPLAALIIAIVAFMISFSQIFVAERIGDKFKREWKGDIEKAVEEVQQNVLKDLEDANVNIRVESGGETVEISTDVKKSSRHEELEELEKETTVTDDTIPGVK